VSEGEFKSAGRCFDPDTGFLLAEVQSLANFIATAGWDEIETGILQTGYSASQANIGYDYGQGTMPTPPTASLGFYQAQYTPLIEAEVITKLTQVTIDHAVSLAANGSSDQGTKDLLNEKLYLESVVAFFPASGPSFFDIEVLPHVGATHGSLIQLSNSYQKTSYFPVPVATGGNYYINIGFHGYLVDTASIKLIGYHDRYLE